jgi:flagellar motor switch protein FliG
MDFASDTGLITMIAIFGAMMGSILSAFVMKRIFLKNKSQQTPTAIESPSNLSKADASQTESQLAFAKGQLIKLAQDYPQITGQAVDGFFAQGHYLTVTLALEALGWDTTKTLFKNLDARLWARIGTTLRERKVSASSESLLDAVNTLHRYALSFVIERSGQEADNPFAFLFNLNPVTRIKLLSHEKPDTIALFSIYCTGKQMGELIRGIPVSKQEQVLAAITKIDHLSESEIKEGLDSLFMRLERVKADPFVHAQGDRIAAEFLRNLDPAHEEVLYSKLCMDHPEEAEQLRRIRAMFPDLLHYPADIIRYAVADISDHDLVRAIAGLPSEFIDSLFVHVQQKRATALENIIDHLTNLPSLPQAADARRRICIRLEQEFEKQNFSLKQFWDSYEETNRGSSALNADEAIEDHSDEVEGQNRQAS